MILFCPFLGISCYFKVQNANSYVFFRFSVKIFLYCKLNTFHNWRPPSRLRFRKRRKVPEKEFFLTTVFPNLETKNIKTGGNNHSKTGLSADDFQKIGF